MKETDTLVIGQGIAGTLVAFNLHLQNIPFVVIDPEEANTCSRIAAGMFTPISGKRRTILPQVPKQLSFAIQVYKKLEQLLDNNILHLQPVYQVLQSNAEKNELVLKLEDPYFANFIHHPSSIIGGIKQPFGAYEIAPSGWVDCALMINSFGQWLKDKNKWLPGNFLHEELKFVQSGMEYNGLVFRHIVFCEGYQGIQNPFFKENEIVPCKGDVLTVKCDLPDPGVIIKKNGIYLVATGKHQFKAGSTYQWNNSNSTPREEEKRFIEMRITAMLQNDFISTLHQSAIRPTTQNRQVIARQHPLHKGMYILNGLGTKGILLGPWWARQVVRLMRKVDGES